MNSIFASLKNCKNMHLIFFKPKKLKKHAFTLDSSVEKLKNYGNIFCKLKNNSKIVEIIFASSQNIDLIFYMLEKAQKYGFGS